MRLGADESNFKHLALIIAAPTIIICSRPQPTVISGVVLCFGYYLFAEYFPFCEYSGMEYPVNSKM
jgi:hypothetical protein